MSKAVGKNAVVDTLAALVYDVNATAEVLRRGSLKRKKKPVAEVKEQLRVIESATICRRSSIAFASRLPPRSRRRFLPRGQANNVSHFILPLPL
jgi:hypothetical protein